LDAGRMEMTTGSQSKIVGVGTRQPWDSSKRAKPMPGGGGGKTERLSRRSSGSIRQGPVERQLLRKKRDQNSFKDKKEKLWHVPGRWVAKATWSLKDLTKEGGRYSRGSRKRVAAPEPRG